jgi:hypothetical protein
VAPGLPHLRTRVEKGGMDYKGYNIAVHELGHNVEQYLSLYEIDHTLLTGVPNTAFTEALAFLFQARDLELLGRPRPDAAAEQSRVLDHFWNTWEIAGSALVEIDVWHWLYDHPNATAAELRDATVRIARATWDRYYAPVLGGRRRDLAARHLLAHDRLAAVPVQLRARPPDRVSARGAPGRQGRRDLRRRVHPGVAPGDDPAR